MPKINELQVFFQSQIALLEELIELSLLKRDALLTDNFDSLEKVVFKEGVLSEKLKALDNACSQQVQFFLEELQSGAAVDRELEDLFQNLQQKIWQLRVNNDFNQTIINDSLNIIRLTMNLLMPQENGAGVYSSSGQNTYQPSSSMVDCKR